MDKVKQAASKMVENLDSEDQEEEDIGEEIEEDLSLDNGEIEGGPEESDDLEDLED